MRLHCSHFAPEKKKKRGEHEWKKGSLINSPIIFYSLKFVLLVKDKLRKIRVFGLEFLNCRCHFFPVPDSPRDAILPWNVGRSHFLFVWLCVCVRPHSLFAAVAMAFDAYVLFATISTQTHTLTNEFHLLFHLFRRIYFTLLFIPLKCYCNWQCVPRLLFVFRFFRFALVWRHNNVHSKLWKIFAKCHHQQLLQRIEDICFCFGFCFLLLCRRKRETFNIVNNIKLQWKCKKGGTEECLSICQYHNRRRNKKLHGEYSKQWRHHNNKSNDVRHIGYFTRSFILHLFFLSYAPFSNWFQSKVKSTAVFAISPKYIRTQTIENGRYI